MQNGIEMRLVFGDQPVGEFDGAVRGRDFGGVDGAGHQDDILAFAKQRLGLGG